MFLIPGLTNDFGRDRSSSGGPQNIHTLFKPVPVQPSPDDINLGEEIAGTINKQALLKQLNRFFQSPEIRALCKEQGLDDYLYHQARSYPAACSIALALRLLVNHIYEKCTND